MQFSFLLVSTFLLLSPQPSAAVTIQISPELSHHLNCEELVTNALELRIASQVAEGSKGDEMAQEGTIVVEPETSLLDNDRLNQALVSLGVQEKMRERALDQWNRLLTVKGHPLLDSIFSWLLNPSQIPDERATLVFLPEPFGPEFMGYFALHRSFAQAELDLPEVSPKSPPAGTEPLYQQFDELGGKDQPRLILMPGKTLLRSLPEDKSEEEAIKIRVAQWWSGLFHELLHHDTGLLWDRWVSRNLWLMAQNRPQDMDPFFTRYTRDYEGNRLLDEGVNVLIGESLSNIIQLDVGLLTFADLPVEWLLLTMENARQRKTDVLALLENGQYGEAVQRLLKRGLEFGGETVEIRSGNFFQIGLDVRAHMLRFLEEHPTTP